MASSPRRKRIGSAAFAPLRDDLALRERMGQAGTRLVAERYSLQMTAPKLLALLRQAVGSRARAAPLGRGSDANQ